MKPVTRSKFSNDADHLGGYDYYCSNQLFFCYFFYYYYSYYYYYYVYRPGTGHDEDRD